MKEISSNKEGGIEMGNRKYKKIDWAKIPSKNEITDMGDTNGFRMDVELNEADGAVITPEEEKISRTER